MDMDSVAKKILAGKKLKKAEPGKGSVKLPPAPTPERMTKKRGALILTDDNDVEIGRIGDNDQGSALKKADSTAPAKSEAVKNSAPKNAKEVKKAKRVIGGVLPESKGFNFKKVPVDDVFKAPAKKGIGKAIKRGAIAAGILGPVGLGVNALMEGLDAEEAGGEELDMEAAVTRQEEKSAQYIKDRKTAPAKPKKLPGAVKSSTKKRVRGLPTTVKKTEVTVKRPPPVSSRSDEDIVKGFNNLLDKNFGPEEDEDDLERLVRDVTLDEMDKGGLKRTSPRLKLKRPVDVTGKPFGQEMRKKLGR